jgi:hypothetical protein
VTRMPMTRQSSLKTIRVSRVLTMATGLRTRQCARCTGGTVRRGRRAYRSVASRLLHLRRRHVRGRFHLTDRARHGRQLSSWGRSVPMGGGAARARPEELSTGG